MKVKIYLTSAAENDYAEALSWYADHSVSIAEYFDESLNLSFQKISKQPEAFPFCDSSHRSYFMRNFPFQIIYKIDEKRIIVLAIAHTSRRPGYWKNR